LVEATSATTATTSANYTNCLGTLSYCWGDNELFGRYDNTADHLQVHWSPIYLGAIEFLNCFCGFRSGAKINRGRAKGLSVFVIVHDGGLDTELCENGLNVFCINICVKIVH
jgi:hypothetical protein